MNDEQYLLASAYVDGEAAADERARAEADAAVMDEVARMRAMRALIADVEPAPVATRTAMLAAAMAEWGQAPAHPVAQAPGASRRPRKRSTMWPQLLSAAAAVVAVVAVGGVLASQLDSGGDDDSAATPAATAIEVTAADLEHTMDQPAEDAEAGGGDDDAAASTSPLSETAPAAPAPEIPLAPADTQQAAGTGVTMSAVPIENLEQLAQTGADLLAQSRLDAPTATTESDCTFAEALVAARGTGELNRDELDATAADARVEILAQRLFRTDTGDLIDVHVAVDIDSGQTYAIDTDCVLIAVAPAPAP